jgi:hypothetical protein
MLAAGSSILGVSLGVFLLENRTSWSFKTTRLFQQQTINAWETLEEQDVSTSYIQATNAGGMWSRPNNRSCVTLTLPHIAHGVLTIIGVSVVRTGRPEPLMLGWVLEQCLKSRGSIIRHLEQCLMDCERKTSSLSKAKLPDHNLHYGEGTRRAYA